MCYVLKIVCFNLFLANFGTSKSEYTVTIDGLSIISAIFFLKDTKQPGVCSPLGSPIIDIRAQELSTGCLRAMHLTSCSSVVVEKARTACFNSGQRIDDHFGDVTDMVGADS